MKKTLLQGGLPYAIYGADSVQSLSSPLGGGISSSEVLPAYTGSEHAILFACKALHTIPYSGVSGSGCV